MPRNIYPTTDKKASLRKFKYLVYRAWRGGDVFGEGVINLSGFTLRRARRCIDRRAITEAITGRTVIVVPETALPAALAICGRLNPPARPDVVVILPAKGRHASRLVGFIVNIFAYDHLDGFKLVLARAPFAPVIAILRPTDRRPEIMLVGVVESGAVVGASAMSWPPHILRQIRSLGKALAADIRIWSRPKSVTAWREYFKNAHIQVLPS